jgi:hypothetical protein
VGGTKDILKCCAVAVQVNTVIRTKLIQAVVKYSSSSTTGFDVDTIFCPEFSIETTR